MCFQRHVLVPTNTGVCSLQSVYLSSTCATTLDIVLLVMTNDSAISGSYLNGVFKFAFRKDACAIDRDFLTVKVQAFFGKINDIFNIFAQIIDYGCMLGGCTSSSPTPTESRIHFNFFPESRTLVAVYNTENQTKGVLAVKHD